MILKSIYAGIACLGFGVLFNIRGKKLIFAALCSGLGWFCYEISLKLTSYNFLSYCIGAIAVGLFSEFMARKLKAPATTFIICGLIPLVPGGGMYYTMLSFIKGDVTDTLTKAFDTLAIAGAIAIGVLIASSIFKVINVISCKKITNYKNVLKKRNT